MTISKEQQEKYLSRRAEDLAQSFTAEESKDADTLRRIGHKMKGSGLTFGFEDIGNIGRQMEEAANAQDWAKIHTLLIQFRDLLKVYTAENQVQ